MDHERRIDSGMDEVMTNPLRQVDLSDARCRWFGHGGTEANVYLGN